MDESWLSILLTVLFVVFPIIFGSKKKKEEKGIEEYEFELEVKEHYQKPDLDIRIQEKKKKEVERVEIKEVEDKIQDVEVGDGMPKEEKKKLIIYSEVMSPKYKEY